MTTVRLNSTADIEAQDDGTYRLPGGGTAYRTTTVCKRIAGTQKDQDALLQWAARLGAQAHAKGLPLSECAKAPTLYRDTRGDNGTLAHAMLEIPLQAEIAKRTGVDVVVPIIDWSDPRTRKDGPSGRAAHNIMAYLSPLIACGKFVPLAVELRLAHPSYPYAGTVDCVALYEGKPYVFDWKTSRHMHDEYDRQVVAYAALVDACTDLGPIHGAMIVRGSQDVDEEWDVRHIAGYEFPTLWAIFKLGLEAERLMALRREEAIPF
jgi:hypothetical protein